MAGSTASLVRRLPPVAVLAALLATAAALGVIGSPSRPERFDAKTIVYAPTPDGTLRVTEIVDIDFGTSQRRGYERVLRTDLGDPSDITAESQTMSDRINLSTEPGELTIRIGDPDLTESGRHRFVLAYTLPEASLDGNLDLSVIDAGEEFETGRFTVVLDGFTLDEPLCSVGGMGTIGGCELETRPDGRQGVVLEPLAAGDGLNLSGVATITGPPSGVDVDPPLPDDPTPATWWRATLVATAAMLGGAWVVRRSIRRGMNTLAVADAAGAAVPPGDSARAPRPGVVMVTDDELAAMTTTEFAPPAGIAPWEGRVLLDETLPAATTGVWLSSMLGAGVLTATESDDAVVLSLGDSAGSASPRDSTLLERLLPGGAARRIDDGYDPTFAAVWAAIADDLRERITARQWWTRALGSTPSGRAPTLVATVVAVVTGLTIALGGLALRVGGSGAVTGNVVVMSLVGASSAMGVGLIRSWGDRAARTAAGSAAYLRVASFRRFLAASEGRHVEEAHRRGVLREYTAWAVALGEAEAWERAAATIGSAAVLTAVTSTAFMHHHTATFSSATTAPSSSSGGGGGGGVGGGGGGGSSGSW